MIYRVADHYPRQSDSRVISGSSVARNSRTARLPPPSSTGRCSGAAKKSSLRSDEAVGRASGSLCRHAATIWRNAGENSSLCNGRTYSQRSTQVEGARNPGGGGRGGLLTRAVEAPPSGSVSSPEGATAIFCQLSLGRCVRGLQDIQRPQMSTDGGQAVEGGRGHLHGRLASQRNLALGQL